MSTTDNFDWSDPRLADHWFGRLAALFYHRDIEVVIGWRELGTAMALAVARHISHAKLLVEPVRFTYYQRNGEGRERLAADRLPAIKGKKVLIVTDKLDESNRKAIRDIVEELARDGATGVDIGVFTNGLREKLWQVRFGTEDRLVRITALIGD